MSLNISTADSKITSIIEELTCPICLDIPVNPVRLRVNNRGNVSFCNEVFCDICFIKHIYNGQKSNTLIKCPVCRQIVYFTKVKSIHDLYIEDKISQKIINKITNSSFKDLSCKYGCGFIAQDINNLRKHHLDDKKNCSNRILKCDAETCMTLSTNGKEFIEHNRACLHKYIFLFLP